MIFLIILGLSITYFPQSTQTSDQRSDNVIQDKLVGKTLLIKPFEVRSSSEDLSNISKSLTDHLIASLPSTILLNVVPRRKSYLVTEEAYSNERMQKALDVSFILSGSMSESKNRVRINLELSNIYDYEESFYIKNLLYFKENLSQNNLYFVYKPRGLYGIKRVLYLIDANYNGTNLNINYIIQSPSCNSNKMSTIKLNKSLLNYSIKNKININFDILYKNNLRYKLSWNDY